jgi:signal transduction histidine kinase
VSMAILFTSTASTQLLGLGYDHILPPLAVIAVAAALGEATRNRRVSMEAITERAVRAEQTRELEAQQRVTDERLRIARELHDAAAHQIAAISLHAGVASHALRTRPDDAERALEIIRASARSVLTEISALLRVLRSAPESADGSPTPPTVNLDALGRLLADFRRSGLQVTKHMDGDLSQVHGAVSFVAYRIIQEALANALKHGADQTADLRVAVSSGLLVIAVTNRVGEQSKETHTSSGHHGLIGVQERVDSVRGTLTLDRGRSGFALRAELPFLTTAPLSKVEK